MTANLDGIIFHQIMPDNTGGPEFDTDGDGVTEMEDEFVSFQNASGQPIDISGWQVWSISAGAGAPVQAQTGLVHEFEEGTILAPGEPLWVVTELSEDRHWATEASEGGDGKNLLTEGDHQSNTNESICLVNPDTGEYIVFNMGGNTPNYEVYSGFPGDNMTGVIDGESVKDDANAGYSYQYDAALGEYVYKEAWIPCFAGGTHIDTPTGWRAVEDLQKGDLVMTRDRGPQPVILLRKRSVQFDTEKSREQAPVEFKTGSLGPGLPLRPLLVSPQHRMLMVDQRGREVLAPAVGLTERCKVRRKIGMKQVSYFHILLDHHAIVMAEGVSAESLFASDEVIRGLSVKDREAIADSYPVNGPLPLPARTLLSVEEVRRARDWQLRPEGFVINPAEAPAVA
ncbi:lamin tail-like protein [Shimia isoporae]|uniref:Lamin tail-like protein n=1 Tax=Shimia isoporae TaxID=647720 RepID=A0A4R1NAV4_9RHOB|nr:Hint domain-containing protein [Shimia isoporae]TCL01239.1 lamin tail-like protein [Shimia isoporae]